MKAFKTDKIDSDTHSSPRVLSERTLQQLATVDL